MRYLLFMASLCILCSCNSRPSGRKLPYEVAHGYFVKNDVYRSQIPACIESKETFDDLFGMAAVMGADGAPTNIDFSCRTVLPLVLDPTDTATVIVIEDVRKKGAKITVTCRVEKGDAQSYTVVPCKLLVIDKEALTPDVEWNITYRNIKQIKRNIDEKE